MNFTKIRRKTCINLSKNEAPKLRFCDVIGDSMSTVNFYYLAWQLFLQQLATHIALTPNVYTDFASLFIQSLTPLSLSLSLSLALTSSYCRLCTSGIFYCAVKRRIRVYSSDYVQSTRYLHVIFTGFPHYSLLFNRIKRAKFKDDNHFHLIFHRKPLFGIKIGRSVYLAWRKSV